MASRDAAIHAAEHTLTQVKERARTTARAWRRQCDD
jgi:hypothetical protein